MDKLQLLLDDNRVVLGIGFAAALLALLIRWTKAPAGQKYNGTSIVVGLVLATVAGLYAGHFVKEYALAQAPVPDDQLGGVASRLIHPIWLLTTLLATVLASGFIGMLTGIVSVERDAAKRVTRGARIGSAEQWQAETQRAQKRANAAPAITLAGCRLEPDDEGKHFAMIGTTGTGKSVAIREMLRGAQARGDRAIIADPDGGFLARFYDPARGDVILNPFDARTVKWDMMAEAENDYAADQLAASLIPDPGGSSDSSWAGRARDLMGAILRRGRLAKIDPAEVYRLFNSASAEELQALLAGTSAEPLITEPSGKMLGNVRASGGQGLKGLEYVANGHGSIPFSITQWARSDARGWVFLPYRADQIDALKPLIGPWMRLAIFAMMSRAEGDKTPTWFVADELDAIGRIQGLDDALQRVRKFGGRCVLGFQTIGKVKTTYGDGIAAALVENCGTRLVLRCAGGDRNSTAEFASSLIGKQTYEKDSTSKGESKGKNDSRSSSTSTTTATEAAVLSSEIEQLDNLNGYMKVPSSPQWYRLKVPFVEMKAKHPSFVAG